MSSESVHLEYVDNVYSRLVCEPGILREVSDHFTYFAPNYKFHPKFRSRVWDGKIRLVNLQSGLVYAGLAKRIKKFCDSRNYQFTFDRELVYDNVSEHEILSHINKLKIPEKFDKRDYQIESVIKCIRTGRRTLLSPTSSGKSLIIYFIATWYSKHKKLIIVPTIQLVNQMEGDFRDYGFKGKIHKSTDGLSRENNIDADVVITTWQSLNNGKTKMKPQWYKQFGVVFGDEAHGAKATSMIEIMCNLKDCKYRFGTTGTLDDQPLNQATIEGLFGPQYSSISTKEMIERGFASKLKIKCIVLRYQKHETQIVKDMDYNSEVDFLVNHNKRNEFIKNLTLSLKGNRLVFFRLRDHGERIYSELQDSEVSNVFHIDGTVDVESREDIRKTMETTNDAILVASLGTTSTGTNIKRLHHMIAASPSKSKIKVLQSIGRMLRLHEEKEQKGAILYDIVDDLSHGKKQNFTLKHFIERCKIYDQEQFEYKIYNVAL
jgi:superfamily II DNA or RNA helicase